jgi:hypothetical protein
MVGHDLSLGMVGRHPDWFSSGDMQQKARSLI